MIYNWCQRCNKKASHQNNIFHQNETGQNEIVKYKSILPKGNYEKICSPKFFQNSWAKWNSLGTWCRSNTGNIKKRKYGSSVRKMWWLSSEAWWIRSEIWWPSSEGWWLSSEAWWISSEIWWPSSEGWWLSSEAWWISSEIWWPSSKGWWLSSEAWWISSEIWLPSSEGWWLSSEAWWISSKIWWPSSEGWWLSSEAWWISSEIWWPSSEGWWLSGSAPDCYPKVPYSNLASPQSTASCYLQMGCHLRWYLGAGCPLGCKQKKENYERVHKNGTDVDFFPLVTESNIIYQLKVKFTMWTIFFLYGK